MLVTWLLTLSYRIFYYEVCIKSLSDCKGNGSVLIAIRKRSPIWLNIADQSPLSIADLILIPIAANCKDYPVNLDCRESSKCPNDENLPMKLLLLLATMRFTVRQSLIPLPPLDRAEVRLNTPFLNVYVEKEIKLRMN